LRMTSVDGSNRLAFTARIAAQDACARAISLKRESIGIPFGGEC